MCMRVCGRTDTGREGKETELLVAHVLFARMYVCVYVYESVAKPIKNICEGLFFTRCYSSFESQMRASRVVK